MTIKILGKTVNIEAVPDNEFTHPNLMGRMDSSKGIIFIRRSMPEDNQEETLLHEIIHYLSELLWLGLKEPQVVALASGLYAVIKENNISFPFEQFVRTYEVKE